MEQRAQGAIEYLLIIGAAILVVAVVVIALTGVLGGAKDNAGSADANAALDSVNCQKDITYLGASSGTCDSTAANIANCICKQKYPNLS